MNTRRSFLGSIGALLSGVPFLDPGKKKVKETFAVKIEEIGEDRWRATIKTSGFFGHKIAVIDSPEYTDLRPRAAYAKTARLFLMFEIQRTMKVHVFPEDAASWNNPLSSAFGPFPNAVPGTGGSEALSFSEEAIMLRTNLPAGRITEALDVLPKSRRI